MPAAVKTSEPSVVHSLTVSPAGWCVTRNGEPPTVGIT